MPALGEAMPVFAAAALTRARHTALDVQAERAFQHTDVTAAGELIHHAGGVDGVNEFYADLDIHQSRLLFWNVRGRLQRAEGGAGPLGQTNYITAKDAVRFLDAVDDGSAFSGPWDRKEREAQRKALLSWMTRSPRKGLGGWLTARLPEAGKKASHKAGWLPPLTGANGSTKEGSVNEIGIVQTSSPRRYAVAILTTGARTSREWDRHTSFVEYASCVIYRAVDQAKDLDCE